MIEFYIPYPDIKGTRTSGKKKQKRTLGNTYGLNAYYAGKHYMERAKDAEFWHLWTLKWLREQRIPKQLYTKPVKITFWWDDKLDVDNHAVMEKFIVDALKGYLIVDDSRKYVAGKLSFFGVDKIIKIQIETI